MSYHNNERFSTPDQDNDPTDRRHCASDYHSGWWYGYDDGHCALTNLNGIYIVPGQTGIHLSIAIQWWALGKNKPLKKTEIKIRRKV